MTANISRLSLPKSIISNNDNTFSQDLLRQFDKKRSRLHFELGFTSQEPSPESSTVNNISFIHEEPIQLDNVVDDEIIDANSSRHQPATSCASKRSSSASDLLKRSSAYLKSKFDLLKKNKSQDEYHSRPRSTIIESTTKPTKLLMKTTISIPSMNINNNTYNNTIMTPPTITQYPPKPLVYSPIEPIPTMSNESKPLLHRISMPLLRVYNQDSPLTRNRSISSLVTRRRKSEPDGHTKRKLRRR